MRLENRSSPYVESGEGIESAKEQAYRATERPVESGEGIESLLVLSLTWQAISEGGIR